MYCKGFSAPNVPRYRLFSDIKNRNSFQAAVCQYAERDAIGLITSLLLGYSVVTCLPAVHKRDDLRLFACFLISPRLMRVVFIYRQEILKDVSLFTSQPKAKFYDELFVNLDLSRIPAHNSKIGRAGYSNHSMICAFIVMKCEGFSQISDLHDYLSNNLIIAHYFGFDISRELPSFMQNSHVLSANLITICFSRY